MRVFVTGASGFVGSAVVQELLQAGHQVVGLARSEASADRLLRLGAEVHLGDLQDLESLRRGAAESEGVIHTAFVHDFSRFEESCALDAKVIEALGDVLLGSDRPFLVTSGVGTLPSAALFDEKTLPAYGPGAHPRTASEKAADAVAAKGVRVSVVRLPPSVHGEGDHGFLSILIDIARKKGVSAFVGEGNNRWPAVHRLDAARLYRLVLEHRGEPSLRFHGLAEEGVAFRDIAEAVGRGLDLPVVNKEPHEAADHFGWFAFFAQMNLQTTSRWTQESLGWKPNQLGLIEDLGMGHYFEAV